MGYMTRDEMVSQIRQGNSVLHLGRLHTAEATLPSEAELAKLSGDPTKVDDAEATLDAQIRALQEAKAKLRDATATPADAEPEPAKADTPKTPPLGQAKAAPTNVTAAPTKPQEPAKK